MKRLCITLVMLFVATICATVLVTRAVAAHQTFSNMSPQKPTPLILQESEGDPLVHRAGPLKGVPLTIKLDGQFGGSEDFFVFTEVLGAGQTIPFHKHENAEEILIFEDGSVTVTIGDKRTVAGPRSMVFIPRDTWISATNTGKKDVLAWAIFSRHGFETYIRAISAKPGEPLLPLTQNELTRLRALGHAVYWDTTRGPYPPGVAH
jgi:mannose-6-phosphate isomerase-like protein (cupin superfamily)